MSESDFDPRGWKIFSCDTIFAPPPLPVPGQSKNTIAEEPPVSSQLVQTTTAKELKKTRGPSVLPVVNIFLNGVGKIFEGKASNVKSNPKQTLKAIRKAFPKDPKTPEHQIISHWLDEHEDSWWHAIFENKSPELMLVEIITDLMRSYDTLNPSGTKLSSVKIPTASSSSKTSKAPIVNPDELVDLDQATDEAANEDEKLVVAERAKGASGRRPPTRKPRNKRT